MGRGTPSGAVCRAEAVPCALKTPASRFPSAEACARTNPARSPPFCNPYVSPRASQHSRSRVVEGYGCDLPRGERHVGRLDVFVGRTDYGLFVDGKNIRTWTGEEVMNFVCGRDRTGGTGYKGRRREKAGQSYSARGPGHITCLAARCDKYTAKE